MPLGGAGSRLHASQPLIPLVPVVCLLFNKCVWPYPLACVLLRFRDGPERLCADGVAAPIVDIARVCLRVCEWAVRQVLCLSACSVRCLSTLSSSLLLCTVLSSSLFAASASCLVLLGIQPARFAALLSEHCHTETSCSDQQSRVCCLCMLFLLHHTRGPPSHTCC